MVTIVRRYGIAGVLAFLAVLAPVAAGAHCAVCVSFPNFPCPSAAVECFTDLQTGIDQCPQLGCFGAATSIGATCGEGAFTYCAVIDGVPVVSATPTFTPSDTPTATPTATQTGTATNTATATDTATATATGTATQTNSPITPLTATPTQTPVPQGGDCLSASQCATGFCADGVCCDTACVGPLEQCNLPGQRGVCSAATAPAPTMSPWALLLSLTVLGGLAAVAMRRRRQGGSSA